MLNLSILLEDSARSYPEREAIVCGDVRLTYAQVDAAANQVANLLTSRGIRPGDKVALSCPNVPYFPIVYYGILKSGGVVVPLNVLLKAREIAYHLDDADVVAYFCYEGSPGLPMASEGKAGFDQVERVKHFLVMTADPASPSPFDGIETLGAAVAGMDTTYVPVLRDPNETAIILFTSGTTGEPKGAELSHANTTMNVFAVNRLWDSPPAADSHLVCLPLFHTFGATVQMHVGFSTAATLHLVPRFDAVGVLEIMNCETITFFAGVPTMWWSLLNAVTEGIDVRRIASNLRIGISGGASLPVEMLEDVKKRFDLTVLEGYGLSETSPVATFSDRRYEPRPGSVGVPIWGVELKLVLSDWTEVDEVGEIGEIAIKGHNVMKGYYNRPEATAEVLKDGWFRTGDLARRDADGFYYIVDRSKDMIIRGGYNVYPREVEEVLMTHPDISLVAVIGVPHPSHGEEVKAVVIVRPDATVTAEELIAWGRAHMASYKYPRIVELVPELPMTATGKVLKKELA